MTINQLILLLDFYRGHDIEIHTATHDDDLKLLKYMKLIDKNNIMTAKGDDLCVALKMIASL